MYSVPSNRQSRLEIVSDPSSNIGLIDAVVRADQNPSVLRAAIKNSATDPRTLWFIYQWSTEGEQVSLRNGSDFSLLRDEHGKESIGYIRNKILGNLYHDCANLTPDLALAIALDERSEYSIGTLLRRGLIRHEDAVVALLARDDCAETLALGCRTLPPVINDAIFQMMVELSQSDDTSEILDRYSNECPETSYTKNVNLSARAKRIKSVRLASCLWEVPDLPKAQRDVIAKMWPIVVEPISMTKYTQSESGKVFLTREVYEFNEFEGGSVPAPQDALENLQILEFEQELSTRFQQFVKSWNQSDYFWPIFHIPRNYLDVEYESLQYELEANSLYKSIVARRVRELPSTVISRLVKDVDPFVRFCLAARNDLPQNIQFSLARDVTEAVRAQVALTQPGLELTKIFLEDESEVIQAIARARRPTPFDLFLYYKERPLNINLKLRTTPTIYGGTEEDWLKLVTDSDLDWIYTLSTIVNNSPDKTTGPAREYLLRNFELGNFSRLADISRYTITSLAGCADRDVRRAVLKSLLGFEITQAKLPGIFHSLPSDDLRLAAILASYSDKSLLAQAQQISDPWVRAGIIYNWKFIDRELELEKKFSRANELNLLGWKLFDERKFRMKRIYS